MQRNQLILVAAGAAVLAFGAIVVIALGPGGDAQPGGPEAAAPSSHGSAPEGAMSGEPQRGASGTGTSRSAGDPGRTTRGDPTVTTDVIGHSASGSEPDGSRPDAESSGSDVAADMPMAARGRSLGIDTDMDEDWAPESEAAQWFEPLDAALGTASPLTPDAFNSIMGEYRDTTIDVFKRSGEIAEAKGPDAGMEFLEEWNSLVEDYKREAYGRPPAE